MQLLHPVPATPEPTNLLAPAPTIVPHAPTPATPTYSGTTSMLIQGDCIPGPDMTVADFCVVHCLMEGVHSKLEENGYSASHTFRYAQWEELQEAGLKAGEIAQLKHAMAMWSLPQGL